jgi:hypothetical protein
MPQPQDHAAAASRERIPVDAARRFAAGRHRESCEQKSAASCLNNIIITSRSTKKILII